jgi:muconate cycloisomerase
MKIAACRATPLRLPLKKPYVWAKGVERAFYTCLIELEAEDGTIGYGETPGYPDPAALAQILDGLGAHLIGHDVFAAAAGIREAVRAKFLAFGGGMPRYINQVSSALEMAAMDLQGKLLGRPVWDLLGGAVRDDVGYFYFLQGDSVEELAADAKAGAEAGHPILYLKVGVGEAYDLAAVAAVRQAAPEVRLRLDANEAWAPDVCLRMLAALAPYRIEYIEQPTSSLSIPALRRITERSPIAIGADQSVFTTADVYNACATGAADMIAVGPREAGGLRATMKAAAIAEGAGLTFCIHSSMTSGITTCAEHHIARAIPNLDDGNQIMWQLLQRDLIADPDLAPSKGRLALPAAPGLGFTLDTDAVAAAAEGYRAER